MPPLQIDHSTVDTHIKINMQLQANLAKVSHRKKNRRTIVDEGFLIHFNSMSTLKIFLVLMESEHQRSMPMHGKTYDNIKSRIKATLFIHNTSTLVPITYCWYRIARKA